MPQASPKWLERMPEFIGGVVTATADNKESWIKSECETIKNLVVESYPKTPNSRKKPMAEIRKAIRDRFPAVKGKTPHEAAPFPYYFTDSGKGNVPRWEHLAIKYLSDEEKQKPEQAETEIKAEAVTEEKLEPAHAPVELLEVLGLTNEESEIISQAVGDQDIKEWVKQAIMQRARTVNKLRESLDADFSEVPSEELMNDKRYRTNSAACRELVSRAVRVIKAWNLDHPEQKWCITNKLISELTGITVKAIAKATEGMDNESYNQGQGLSPVVNRMVRAAAGEPSDVMSLAKVASAEGSERDYQKG